jgi:hypothetical protein
MSKKALAKTYPSPTNGDEAPPLLSCAILLESSDGLKPDKQFTATRDTWARECNESLMFLKIANLLIHLLQLSISRIPNRCTGNTLVNLFAKYISLNNMRIQRICQILPGSIWSRVIPHHPSRNGNLFEIF